MAKKDTKSAADSSVKRSADQAKNGSEGFDAAAFSRGTREELAKVIWPTRQQLISESAAVILMVGLSATLIYFIDKLFGWASRQVF